mmetsp:Transcript_41088/g.99026  ORF Transcript_41088/g.99026 Transcript_41088/m.99026 type:complete len:87 (+) Transcript_41088:240-500(+)
MHPMHQAPQRSLCHYAFVSFTSHVWTNHHTDAIALSTEVLFPNRILGNCFRLQWTKTKKSCLITAMLLIDTLSLDDHKHTIMMTSK